MGKVSVGVEEMLKIECGRVRKEEHCRIRWWRVGTIGRMWGKLLGRGVGYVHGKITKGMHGRDIGFCGRMYGGVG